MKIPLTRRFVIHLGFIFFQTEQRRKTVRNRRPSNRSNRGPAAATRVVDSIIVMTTMLVLIVVGRVTSQLLILASTTTTFGVTAKLLLQIVHRSHVKTIGPIRFVSITPSSVPSSNPRRLRSYAKSKDPVCVVHERETKRHCCLIDRQRLSRLMCSLLY